VALALPSMKPKSRRELYVAIRRIPVAATFAAALFFSNLIMVLLPHSTQLSIANAASTNITHLAVDPFFVLPASAFVDTTGGWFWIPLSIILLGGLERRLGSRRSFLIVFGAHVMATLISEATLLVQVTYHLQPKSAINVLDVGPSYVMLAAMAGCLAIGSRNLRIFAGLVAVLLVPGLLLDLPQLDMSSVGHFFSLVFGVGLTLGYARVALWAKAARREAALVAAHAAERAVEVAAPAVQAAKAVAPTKSRATAC
jgi:hypothetical protein